MINHNEIGELDLGKHRFLPINDRTGKEVNKVHFERRDPYGFWHVWLDKGTFPEKSPLNGVYNNFEMMISHIEGYIATRNEAVSEIRSKHLGETVNIPDRPVA